MDTTVDGRTAIGWHDDGVAETWSERALPIASDKHGIVIALESKQWRQEL